jgi:hypothetical protein
VHAGVKRDQTHQRVVTACGCIDICSGKQR